MAETSRRIPPTPSPPLERLDGGGVVVALDLERDGLALAEVEDAGVLARPLQDALARRGQALQQRAECL